MTKFLAGVLSVIAVGVLLIAYGLLNLRAAAFDPRAHMDPYARPIMTSERMQSSQDPYAPRYVYSDGTVAPAPSSYASYPGAQPAVYQVSEPRAVRTVAAAPAPRRVASSRRVERVERAPGRDWRKAALVIGGSTAGGAGLGAIFGGKKGALIGAAIGGGASTLYEATKR